MFKKKRMTIMLEIDMARCTGCGKCVSRCKGKVLRMRYSDDLCYAVSAYPDSCQGCGRCATVCSSGALGIQEISNLKTAY